jgi:hypothetical protein
MGAAVAATSLLVAPAAAGTGPGSNVVAAGPAHGIGVLGTLLVVVVLLAVGGVLLAVVHAGRGRRTRYRRPAAGPAPYDEPGYGPGVGRGTGW